ncbi:MAG: preprotein translocase subunit SecE [Candidatus Dormibacteria bacterium]
MARSPARTGPTTGGSGGRRPRRLTAYFRGVWDELRKVVWPTWPELTRMTGVVVVTVVLFSLLIGGADYALGYAVKPIYVQNASTSTTSTPVPASTATPSATATPSPSASASS